MGNGTVVRKFKMWLVWQDEAHEQWLERMAAQGLHLRDTNAIGLHSFVRGAPADVAYRWDVGNQLHDPQYQQLFQDAGWEYVTSTSGWHCWRKPRRAGVVTEIFTDNADRMRKYQRVLTFLAPAAAAQVLMGIFLISRHWQELLTPQSGYGERPIAAACLAVTSLACYGVARLIMRIRDLKSAEPGGA